MNKKEYEEIKKRYNLPSFEFLDNEFNISSIEKLSNILRQIKEKIVERIEFITELLDNHLHPEIDSFASAYECNCFNDKEKEELVIIYKQLMRYNRSLLLADLSVDDKLTARTINEVSNEWVETRKELLKFVKKLKEHWENIKETKELLRYLG